MTFLRPTYVVEHVTDINLDDLKAEGICGLMFDLDNTLMAPHSGQLTADIATWLSIVKESFQVVILSNNPRDFYIEKAAQEIGCVAYGRAKKPQIKTASKALKEMKLLPCQVAMIGDRPLTDILVGQKMKFTTILVEPLVKRQKISFVRFLRKIEKLLLSPPKKNFTEIKN